MSWTRAYRLALYLLPAGLRRKHGPAMEALFARELGRACARGRLHGALAGAAGVWDVVRRGAYEQARPTRHVPGERRGRGSRDRWSVEADGPRAAGAGIAGPRMPPPTTHQLLRRHVASFAISLLALTAALLALFARRQVPALSARGAPAGTIAEALLFAVPFTAALTIPMAVFIAVLLEFTRLRADGTLAAARRTRGGVRRLVAPVLAGAVAVAALTLVSNTAVLPHANERLAALIAGRPAATRSDREMTVGELRTAARRARAESAPEARAVAAVYEVEVHKKFALAAAGVVLALAGVAIALRVPRGGAGLVIGASGAVFGAYYVLILTGETLAERLVVSPFVGMWGANALLLAAALPALWVRPAPRAPGGGEAVAVRG